MSKRWVAIPMLLVLLLAAVFFLFPREEAAPGDRWAWITAPEDGAVIPVADTIVAVGAVDSTGVALVELYADGEFVEGRLFADTPTEVRSEFLWDPQTPGEHQLTVRERGTDSNWGRAATVFVLADDAEEADVVAAPSTAPGESPVTAPPQTTTTPPTATTVPATTTTAEPTMTTTTETPCRPTAPGLIAPRPGSVVANPIPVFSWSYPGEDPCRPRAQAIEIGPIGDGAGDVVVEVSPGSLEWRPRSRLRDCTTYSWRVIAGLPEGELASSAWVFHTDFPKTDAEEPCP